METVDTSVIVDEELLSVRVAELYYDAGKTQDEIGALLGISRWKAGRLLTQARESGIVRIEIVHPSARRLGVERALRTRFPRLTDAVVVPAFDDEAALVDRVSQAAAEHLRALRPVPRTLGVSWGRTLTAVADRLQNGWARGVTVVQVNGGVSVNRRPGGAAHLASTIAERASGDVVLLPSPAILEQEETAHAIQADRTVAAVLDRAADADAYIFSAGVCDASSAHVENGYLTLADIRRLQQRGAVGDVLGRYIDADGNIVDPALDVRTVGMPLSRLRSAATAIFVTAGAAKHDLARTVVGTGLCTVIVTDETTARALLEES
ncbi:sugar-binding transcriptional regulator [Microbacterium sp. ASV49]|uniref:Sugar-binding transcriptional regulator n=1 Tax=Microbacterium candidum TaxID=3041922 RepID=A0ABT7N364_9MICO|nr:sugar-binding transcriptional regulator [Microbacterium sp. ASV49]MDL9981145.1 sugar-binding transcriptional regulator [Microbacterium sp. ASV49]